MPVLEDMTPPTVEEFALASGVAKNAAKNWQGYCGACRRRFDMIGGAIASHYGDRAQDLSVLDWGCAAGGVSILLATEMGLHMHSADVCEHSIAWLSRVAPFLSCSTLIPGEALPFDDARFDIVFGISVFTHLPPDAHDHYLGELRRITVPGGLVMLTVHSHFAVRHNAERKLDPAFHPYEDKALCDAGILYRSYPAKTLDAMAFAEHADYGLTYHSREFIESRFGRFFDILSIEEGRLGRQDLLTLRPL